MKTADLIQRYETLVAANGGQKPGTIKLVRYQTFEDWAMPQIDGQVTQADFKTTTQDLDAFAKYLTEQGVPVIGKQFDRTAYDQWRGPKSDTRDLRSEWALNNNSTISFAFKISHDAVSWAVLNSGENL